MSKGRICSRLNEVPNVYDKKRWKFFFTPFTITKDLWVKGDLFYRKQPGAICDGGSVAARK